MNVQPQGPVGMQQVAPQQPQQQIQMQQAPQGPQQQQTQQPPQQPNQSVQQNTQPGQQQAPQQPGQPPNLQQQQPGTPGTQAQQLQQQQQTQEKLDNISKVKSLVGPLKEHLTAALKSAAHLLHFNTMVDNGSSKGLDAIPRFEKDMETFYSACDQIELHLKTAIECLCQGASSMRYMPFSVLPTRTEPLPGQEGLLYPQYLATIRSQIAFAKQVHDTLMVAIQNLSALE